jgi:hypothetical protein
MTSNNILSILRLLTPKFIGKLASAAGLDRSLTQTAVGAAALVRSLLAQQLGQYLSRNGRRRDREVGEPRARAGREADLPSSPASRKPPNSCRTNPITLSWDQGQCITRTRRSGMRQATHQRRVRDVAATTNRRLSPTLSARLDPGARAWIG